MTSDDLFLEIGDAYLTLIHLGDGVDQAVARIFQFAQTCPSELVGELLRDGDSWRERLSGLVLASRQGIHRHFDSLIRAWHNTGGISIVPISAATSVAVRDFGCTYDPQMTARLDRDAWDGEVGFALDWLHHTVGIGAAPKRACGPNYGQNFATHLKFYENLNRA